MTTSIVIVGSGPAAWSAAMYVARSGLVPEVITGDSPGGQLMLTTVVENFPGFPEGIEGSELLVRLQQQAEKFGAKVTQAVVEAIVPGERSHKLITSQGEIEAKAVIVATGAKAKWLNIPGEAEFIGRGVSACAVCDAAFFRDKAVAVVGGGDAAMEDALALSRFCSSVQIIHRRDSFRASQVMIDKVKQKSNIKVEWNTVVEAIYGQKTVEGVEIREVGGDKTEKLPVQGVFVAIGHEPATAFLRGIVELDELGYVKTGWGGYSSMTSVKGVFAGGDCMDPWYRQASTAAGFGVMAGLDAQRYIERGEKQTED